MPFIAHRYLYNRVKILHCDLSVNNVLLNRKDDSSEPVGLLIDYDYLINADHQDTEHGSLCAAEGPLGDGVVSVAEVPFGIKEESAAEKVQSQIPRTVCYLFS